MSGIAPASLQFQLDHISDNRSLGLKVTFIISLVLANVAVGLRILSRRMARAPLKADDYTIIIALVLWYGLSTINFLHAYRFGLGLHMAAVGAVKMSHFLKALYAYSLFYTPIILLIKVSLLLLYHRIFVTRRFQWHVKFWVGFIILFGVSTYLVDIFFCTPIPFFWDRTIPGGHCIDTYRYYMACAALNIFTDLVILILPMPMIWQLQVPIRQKLVLMSIFFLGGMCCIATVFRLVTFPYIDNNDLSWTYVMCSYWTNSAEIPLAFICACLPTMRPLFRRVLPVFLTRGSRGKPSGYSGSSSPSKGHWLEIERKQGHSEVDSTDAAENGAFMPMRQNGLGGASGAWHDETSPPARPVPIKATNVKRELDLSQSARY